MNMNLINLTPHAIRIIGADGAEITTLQPSGSVARVAVTRHPSPGIGTIPVSVPSFGAVAGLPAPAPGTVYIVSAMVREASRDRRDVYSPGELVRGADGQPIGCRGLDGNA